MFDVGLIAAACLVPLAPVIAQGIGAGPTPAEARAQIMRVQQDLNDHGFTVPVDGAMGANTVAALRSYQQLNGLPATGRIDGPTFTELEGIASPRGGPPAAPVIVQPSSVQAVPGAPPPAPQVEVVPPPPAATPGMVWQQGAWNYQNGNWVWVPGQYIARPQGYSVWMPGQWTQQPDGHYVWNPGHWS
jgi:peptidoglycan hydrolase-like protein with peptidoglycan-binding domain